MFSRMSKAVSPLLQEIFQHPFNQQMYTGVLPRNIFNFYLQQDAYYLKIFSQALLLTAKRLSNPIHTQLLRSLSKDTVAAEQDIHSIYFKTTLKFFKPKTDFKLMPATADYTNHLLHHAANSSPEMAVASLAPCFWIYNELGKLMKNVDPANPYRDWIASYSCPKFCASTKAMIMLIDELEVNCPRQQLEVINVFKMSAHFEQRFWAESYLGKVPESYVTNPVNIPLPMP
jgi:thiaminase/transcriptional activator TenA